MAGYTRTDTTNNIADGNIINATDLDNEFDGIQAAFNSSTGHNHDGTTGEGAPILVLGPTQDVVVGASTVTPKTTNTVDIGSSSLKFKDLFLAGNASIGGTLAVTGVATLTAQPILSSLTASRAVFTDGSKGLVSNAITGTGNVVMSASPTLTGTIGGENATLSGTLGVTGVATFTAQPIVSSLTASRAVFSDGSKGLVSNAITGTGNVVMSAAPTLTGTITAEALTLSGATTLNGGTANGVAYLNGSKVLTTGSALTFDGTRLTSTTGKFGSGAASNSASLMVNNVTNTATGIQLFQDGIESWIMGMPANSAGLAWSASGAEQMRLTSTGLGIGTSSPGYKLDVSVGTNTIAQQWQGAGTNFTLRLKSGTGSTPSSSVYRLYMDYLNGSATNGYVDFYRGGGGGDGWLVFGTSGTDRMTLDSSGNLGLGVTPSAWVSSWKSVDVTSGGASLYGSLAIGGVGVNAYFDSGAVWRYKTSYAAGRYEIGSTGVHSWYTAPSGTAGNAISFTQAMTLDASGNLLVGTTSSFSGQSGRVDLSLNGSSNSILSFGVGGVRKGYLYCNPDMILTAEASTLLIQTTSSQPITFATNSTERARIDSSGNLLVGQTSSTSRLAITQPNADWCVNLNTPAAGTQYFSIFRYNGSEIGRITGNNTATSYSTSSDYRLKNTIAPMTGALAKVALLKPCTYKWNADGSDGEGFIAHELAEVVPQCVTGEKDAVDAEGKPQYQGIDTSFLVATLTAAIQEQQVIINSLKARLDAANL